MGTKFRSRCPSEHCGVLKLVKNVTLTAMLVVTYQRDTYQILKAFLWGLRTTFNSSVSSRHQLRNVHHDNAVDQITCGLLGQHFKGIGLEVILYHSLHMLVKCTCFLSRHATGPCRADSFTWLRVPCLSAYGGSWSVGYIHSVAGVTQPPPLRVSV